MSRSTQEKILTTSELVRRAEPLPESWKRAAGLLRGKRQDLEEHLRQVRREWDKGRSGR